MLKEVLLGDMKRRTRQGSTGFTLIELLMVIAVIAILASLLLPAINKGIVRARQAQCASNLKQVGVAFISYAGDHNNLYGRSVPINDGGYKEIWDAAAAGNSAYWPYFRWIQFAAISNHLVDAKVLVCPADKTAVPTNVWSGLRNRNVSYAINEATSYTSDDRRFVADRNLTNVFPASPLFELPDTGPIGFNGDRHQFRGNVLFADGHVEQVVTSGSYLMASGSGGPGSSGGPGPTFNPGSPPGSPPPGSSGGTPPSSPPPGGGSGTPGQPPAPSGGGGGSSPGGGGSSGTATTGSSGGGVFGNLDEALGGGRQPSGPNRAPRSSSSSTAMRTVVEPFAPEAQLMGSRKGPSGLTNVLPKVDQTAEAEVPKETTTVADSFRHTLAMPILEGERINYKAILLLLLAAYFTFEILRRHRRRRALRRTYSGPT